VYFCAAPEGTLDAVAGSGVGVGAAVPHGVDCAVTGVADPVPLVVDVSEDDADGAVVEADVWFIGSGFCAMASARWTVKSL
jgi:hypothetical protein